MALLALSILGNTAGNFLIKKAGINGDGLALFINPYFIAGTVLFAMNLIAYTLAIKTVPLTIAYPLVIGGSLILISLTASLGFGEVLSWPRITGMALILLGASLVVR